MSKRIDASWVTAETIPALLPGEVHIWKIHLDSVTGQESEAPRLATDEDRTGASDRDDIELRRRSTARTILKAILAAYLKVSPGDVRLSHNGFGKPVLDPRYHPESV